MTKIARGLIFGLKNTFFDSLPKERASEFALSQSYDIIFIILVERLLVLEKFIQSSKKLGRGDCIE
jgi:hypothetical protein